MIQPIHDKLSCSKLYYTMTTIFYFHKRHLCNIIMRRAIYQSSLWSNSTTPLTNKPSPEDHGWRKTENGWRTHWTDLIYAVNACRELRCGCKALSLCTRKYRCNKAGLGSQVGCTTLCSCEGDCDYQIDAWAHISKLTTKIDWNNIMHFSMNYIANTFFLLSTYMQCIIRYNIIIKYHPLNCNESVIVCQCKVNLENTILPAMKGVNRICHL